MEYYFRKGKNREFSVYMFDLDWRDGQVHCEHFPMVDGHLFMLRPIEEPPPETCPYLLEHMVSHA
jgi:hypothetical protein